MTLGDTEETLLLCGERDSNLKDLEKRLGVQIFARSSTLAVRGNARKVDGKEIPYYQMLLGGGFDGQGMARFGLAVQSIPARTAPLAVKRVLDHYISNRLPSESFRDYVMRYKVEFFRETTNDLAKPAEIAPEMYIDWGDDTQFSLKLGRGECAA